MLEQSPRGALHFLGGGKVSGIWEQGWPRGLEDNQGFRAVAIYKLGWKYFSMLTTNIKCFDKQYGRVWKLEGQARGGRRGIWIWWLRKLLLRRWPLNKTPEWSARGNHMRSRGRENQEKGKAGIRPWGKSEQVQGEARRMGKLGWREWVECQMCMLSNLGGYPVPAPITQQLKIWVRMEIKSTASINLILGMLFLWPWWSLWLLLYCGWQWVRGTYGPWEVVKEWSLSWVTYGSVIPKEPQCKTRISHHCWGVLILHLPWDGFCQLHCYTTSIELSNTGRWYEGIKPHHCLGERNKYFTLDKEGWEWSSRLTTENEKWENDREEGK